MNLEGDLVKESFMHISYTHIYIMGDWITQDFHCANHLVQQRSKPNLGSFTKPKIFQTIVDSFRNHVYIL